MYPFMFLKIGNQDQPEETQTWYVLIASHIDYTYYDSSWMSREELGSNCLEPDVDLCSEVHKFDCEAEAINFIRKWWRAQPE